MRLAKLNISFYQPSVLTFQGEQHRYLLHRPDQQQTEASPVQHTQRPWQHDDWRKEEAKFQDGFQHGDSTPPHHQVFHGGSILQHDTAAGRDAKVSDNKKGKYLVFCFIEVL